MGVAGEHPRKKETVYEKGPEARISGRATVTQHGWNTEFKEESGQRWAELLEVPFIKRI